MLCNDTINGVADEILIMRGCPSLPGLGLHALTGRKWLKPGTYISAIRRECLGEGRRTLSALFAAPSVVWLNFCRVSSAACFVDLEAWFIFSPAIPWASRVVSDALRLAEPKVCLVESTTFSPVSIALARPFPTDLLTYEHNNAVRETVP